MMCFQDKLALITSADSGIGCDIYNTGETWGIYGSATIKSSGWTIRPWTCSSSVR